MPPPLLTVWPRTNENRPFDAAEHNRLSNFSNGFLAAPQTWSQSAGGVPGLDWDPLAPSLGVGAPLSVTAPATFTSTVDVDGAATFDGAVTLGNAAGDAISILGTATFTPLATFLAGATLSGGNLTFGTTAQRILGDFSNATVLNRTLFQTLTANGFTGVDAIPNGSGAGAAFEVFSTANPAASARLIMYAGTTDHFIISDQAGASLLPLTIMAGGAAGLKITAVGDTLLGSSTSLKIGFFGDAGAVQPTAGAAADGTLAGATTLVNALRTGLRNLGLFA